MKAIFGHDLAAEILVLRLVVEGYQINLTWPWSWSFDCAISLRGKALEYNRVYKEGIEGIRRAIKSGDRAAMRKAEVA